MAKKGTSLDRFLGLMQKKSAFSDVYCAIKSLEGNLYCTSNGKRRVIYICGAELPLNQLQFSVLDLRNGEQKEISANKLIYDPHNFYRISYRQLRREEAEVLAYWEEECEANVRKSTLEHVRLH